MLVFSHRASNGEDIENKDHNHNERNEEAISVDDSYSLAHGFSRVVQELVNQVNQDGRLSDVLSQEPDSRSNAIAP